jgi:hypothetical protein
MSSLALLSNWHAAQRPSMRRFETISENYKLFGTIEKLFVILNYKFRINNIEHTNPNKKIVLEYCKL